MSICQNPTHIIHEIKINLQLLVGLFSSCRRPHKYTPRFGVCRKSYLLCSNTKEIEPVATRKNPSFILNHRLGGGQAVRALYMKDIESYICSAYDPSTGGKFRFKAYVDQSELQSYSQTEYIHTLIPLPQLVRMVTLIEGRKIAQLHGIQIGSRCSMQQLHLLVAEHTCTICPQYYTVFKIDSDNAALAAKRMQKCRSKVTEDFKPHTNIFPPHPSDAKIIDRILQKACGTMSPTNFQEAGCAVCGELKPLRTMVKLRSLKNLLHVLEKPGVTRVVRKSNKEKIRGLKGPVLDHSCNQICIDCRKVLRQGKVPKFALANDLWLGEVPQELKELRFVEKILVSRVRHTCAYVKVASGMRKMKANVVAFESPIPKIYDALPPPRDDMDEVLAILFTGPSKPTSEDLNRTPFLVRKNYVARALQWLKLNHSDYEDINISEKNLNSYPEDMAPVSIEYREAETNKVPEGTSVFDPDDEDGTEEGQCAFSVHGLTTESLEAMTTSELKIMALRHLNNNGKMLAVGHSSKLESIYNNPQLYPMMFPWLFPFGLGGIGVNNLSDSAHKRHLLMYLNSFA